MVWIHGGAYIVGSGNDTHKRSDYLMTKDIILVSINYRLGAFGKVLPRKYIKCFLKNSYHLFVENIEQSTYLYYYLLIYILNVLFFKVF